MGSQVMNVLNQKLSERFASDGNGDVTKFIGDEVQKLFKRRGSKKISSSDLQDLERKIERGVKAVRRSSEIREQPDTPRAVILNKEKPGRINYDEVQKNVPFPLNNYLVFNEAMSYEYHQEERQRKVRDKQKRQQMRNELDRQIQEKAKAGGDTRAIEEKYAEQVRKNYADWKEEQIFQRREMVRKNQITKAEQDMQLQQNQLRRERAKKHKQAEEEKMIQRAKDEIEKEIQRQKAQVEEQRQYMYKVQHDNEKLKLIRQEEKRKAQEYDKRLQAEYAARLDEQERLRAETFAKMKEKSSNNQQMYIKATEEKVLYDQEVERKAREYQQAKIEADNRKEEAAIARQEQAKKDMNERLAKQIADKKKANEILERENEIFASKFKQEALTAIEAEKEAERGRRRRAKEMKEQIKKQIEEKLHRQSDTDTSLMTEHEKRLNLPKMLTFTKDDGMLKAIEVRLEKATAAEQMKAARRMGQRRQREEDDYIY